MITEGLKGRDFITLRDFTTEEIDTMLEVALRLKADNTMRRQHCNILAGRTLFMMFFNPSLRTRNSFETGIFELGGHANFLVPEATMARRISRAEQSVKASGVPFRMPPDAARTCRIDRIARTSSACSCRRATRTTAASNRTWCATSS